MQDRTADSTARITLHLVQRLEQAAPEAVAAALSLIKQGHTSAGLTPLLAVYSNRLPRHPILQLSTDMRQQRGG